MQRVLMFQSHWEFEDLVNGAICTGAMPPSRVAGRYLGLHGLTLVFTAPSLTVTFSDPSGAGLSIADICAAIATAGLKVQSRFGDRISIYHLTDGTAVALASTGTANKLLGFSTAADTSGKVYAPPTGAKPRWTSISSGVDMGKYLLTVEE